MAGVWWFLIGLAAGLLVGGGGVYLLTYRKLQKFLRERQASELRLAPSVRLWHLRARREEVIGQRKMASEERLGRLVDVGRLVDDKDIEQGRMIEGLEMDFDEAPPLRRSRRAQAAGTAGAEPPQPPAPDLVHFSVTAPPSVLASSTFLLSVWAHLDSQRAEVLARARQELGEEPAVSTRGPARVKRGTRLAFHVEVEGMNIEEPVGWVDWEGEPAQAAFFVDAPADASAGNHKGRVSVCVEGVPIMELRFLIRVGEAAAESAPLTTEIQRYRSAFASYSSKDRAEVFKRIQGIHQVAPDLDIFVDVDSLRSGQDWERELWRQISSRDVFFLFWSSNALKSKWVEKEWRFALEKRGLDFIDPVPLEPPDQAPPPPELSSKHFNDRELVFIKAYSS